jgi:transposase
MQKRRNYSKEFKCEAVNLANDPGVTLNQVARELGIGAGLLGRWRRELSISGHQAFKGQGHARDEEMMGLKRELIRVKKERDFLKEAATFFAKESS